MNKHTKARILAACKRIIRATCILYLYGIMPAVNDDGYTYLCNGYQVVRFYDYTPNLPVADNPEAAEKARKLPAIVEEVKKAATISVDPIFADDVKIFMKESGLHGFEKREQPYKLADNYYLACGLLLNMLEALPGAKIMIPGYSDKACYFEAENGDGILMPYLVREKDEEDMKGVAQ